MVSEVKVAQNMQFLKGDFKLIFLFLLFGCFSGALPLGLTTPIRMTPETTQGHSPEHFFQLCKVTMLVACNYAEYVSMLIHIMMNVVVLNALMIMVVLLSVSMLSVVLLSVVQGPVLQSIANLLLTENGQIL